MLLCGYTPVTWQTFPATPKCLITNFFLISTSPFSSYLSLTKMWYWNQLLKNANSIKALKLVNDFFLSLFLSRNCQLAFQPHQNNQGLSKFSYCTSPVPLLSVTLIPKVTSFINCNPVTSSCKSMALLPCLTTQNSANSLQREHEQCWVFGYHSLLPGLGQPINIYSHTGSCKDNADGQTPSTKISTSINQTFLNLLSCSFCCDLGDFSLKKGNSTLSI